MKNIPEFIRCASCRSVTSKEIITSGDMEGCRCGGKKFHSTNPSLLEEIVFLIKHPSSIKFIRGIKK